MSGDLIDVLEASAPDAREPRSSSTKASAAALLGSLVLLAVCLSVLHVRSYTVFSPIDELQHFDYALKAPDGHIVKRGELIQTSALREEACRGLDYPLALPSCDARTLDRDRFQNASLNTAYIHPPTYYFLAGHAGRMVQRLLDLDSPFVAVRLTGALWLVAAVVLCWSALAELGCRMSQRAAALLCLVAAPMSVFSAATVTPDSTALAAGALVLLLVLRYEAGRAPAWMLLGAGILVVTLRVNNLFAPATGALFLALRAQSGGLLGAERRRVLAVAAALMLLPVGFGGAWFAFAESSGSQLASNEPFLVEHFPLPRVVEQVTATFTPLRSTYVPQILSPPGQLVLVQLLEMLLVGALVGCLAWGAAGSAARRLAGATTVGMVSAGPLLAAAGALSGLFIPIPSRYGLAMVPFGFAILATSLRSRVLLSSAIVLGLWSAARIVAGLWSG